MGRSKTSYSRWAVGRVKVMVDAAPEQVTVIDVDDLQDLRVVASMAILPRLDALLRAHRYGSFDGEHAWLDIEALRAANPGANAAWQADFAAMIAYAESRGWVSAHTGAVRAHCDAPV